MRTAPFAAVALACALAGAFLALALAKAVGWAGSDSTATVFRSSPLPPVAGAATPAAVGPAARPLTGNGFDPKTIYARRSPGVVTIVAVYGTDPATAQKAQGSGFVVSPKGYILTNSHVITTAGDGAVAKPADRVYVEFQDRDRVEAKIVGWDVFDDVGLIRVAPSAHALAPVPLGNSAGVTVGEPVAAIGSPFGNENSLAVGVVSATKRSVDSLTSNFNLVDAIQTDALINHGNSGGPLFDARGRVIGLNAQIRSTSGNAEGVGFSVAINSAKRSMQQLIANGSVSYAFVGVETEDLTPSLAKRFDYPVERGAVITNVVDGGPAAAAGLRGGSGRDEVLGIEFIRGGDVIVAIDGQIVRSAADIVRIVTDSLSPGQIARFTIQRGNARREVPVRLGERPETTG
ncbi:MAG: trypsin-like peptidase domain-containing protein [Actinomycetota bacterium]|nr:trypsin-like peptidase domain-containing protein [Actinomycetota bacterium]